MLMLPRGGLHMNFVKKKCHINILVYYLLLEFYYYNTKLLFIVLKKNIYIFYSIGTENVVAT